MSFATVRHTLFTVHMWVGLILGVLLAALGLSGSLLVYDEAISDLIAPPPRAATAGPALPLSMIAGIARDAAASKGVEGGQLQIHPAGKEDRCAGGADRRAFRPWAMSARGRRAPPRKAATARQAAPTASLSRSGLG